MTAVVALVAYPPLANLGSFAFSDASALALLLELLIDAVIATTPAAIATAANPRVHAL